MEIYKRPTTGYARSVRPVLFHSKAGEDYYFSSHGGTVVLVRKGTRLYGITCRHVLGGHEGRDLSVHFDLNGDTAYKPNMVIAVIDGGLKFSETEIEDVLLVRWDHREQFDPAFNDAIDLENYTEPETGDVLGIAGFLKGRSDYAVYPAKTFCFQTRMLDVGYGTADPLLRKAEVELDTNEHEDSTGLSGGIVFNLSKQVPAGIIVRASRIAQHFVLHYLPFRVIKNVVNFIDNIPAKKKSYIAPQMLNFQILSKNN